MSICAATVERIRSCRVSLGQHRDALGYRCLSKRFIRSGEGETGTRCEVKISGIIRRDILAARRRLQIHICPEALGLDPYWQRLKKAQVFGNLLLGDSLTLAIRDENVVMRGQDKRHHTPRY